MRPGIFAKTFAGSDPVTLPAASKVAGFACTQYDIACSGPADCPSGVLAVL